MIKGKYQFTFGENKENPIFSGFLIPHSGRLKKIAARLEGQNYSQLVGSLFSFFLTKKENTQIRLADYILKVNIDISEEERIIPDPGGSGVIITAQRFTSKCYFDNDLENYPISEGDVINIRTEKDYAKYKYFDPIENNRVIREEDARISAFFAFLIELDPL